MNCAEKRFYQKKPLSPGCRCVVFLAVLPVYIFFRPLAANFQLQTFNLSQYFSLNLGVNLCQALLLHVCNTALVAIFCFASLYIILYILCLPSAYLSFPDDGSYFGRNIGII